MKKTTQISMEKLHEVITNRGTEFYRVKIVKQYGTIFKITYQNRNGVSGVSAEVLTKNGDFAHILNKFDIGYELTTSYVSSEDAKIKDSANAIKVTEELILKIYKYAQ
jgi:hypothetical protein